MQYFPSEPKSQFPKMILFFVFIIIFFIVVMIFYKPSTTPKKNYFNIKNFQDCVAAGYPIMQSYPRQCSLPNGNFFTETAVQSDSYHTKPSASSTRQ